MIASHFFATLALLLFISANSTHGTACAATAVISSDASHDNVDVQFSIVATANDHADCVDDEEAHANKLFLRHHSKAGKSKKTSKSSKSRRGKSAKKCHPTDVTASHSKETATSTAPPTGVAPVITATPEPTSAFIEPTLAPLASKVDASTLIPFTQTPSRSPSKESATSTAPPTGAAPVITATPGPTSAFIEPTLAPLVSKVDASTLIPFTQTPSRSPSFTRLESLKLVAGDGAAMDQFGWSVAIYGDTVVVGAAADDDKGKNSGSAYIYHLDSETKELIFQQKLVADDGFCGDWFGSSVAIYGDTLVVGSIFDDDNGNGSGSAYIYHQDPGTKEWIMQQKLVPDDGAIDDRFGGSVAIFGDTLVVGAHWDGDKGYDSGSAYIYHEDPVTKEWILRQKLVPDDGAEHDQFGWSVAIYGNTVVVGAYGDDDKAVNDGSFYIKGVNSGSVYIYHQSTETKEWIMQQKLVPDVGAPGDYFGWSVAIYGNTLVVGASYDDTDKGYDSGSAYIYHQSTETKEWIIQQKLVPDDGAIDDRFGDRVAIYNGTVVVGAYLDDDKGEDSGSVYIYHQSTETKEWIMQQKLVADDGAEHDQFGWSVAIYNGTVAVGAYGDDDTGENSGSVYVYS